MSLLYFIYVRIVFILLEAETDQQETIEGFLLPVHLVWSEHIVCIRTLFIRSRLRLNDGHFI